MNRTESQHIGYLADRILVFADQFFALLQLDVQEVVLGRTVQMSLEQSLQGRAGDKELMADFFYRNGFCYMFVHIGENLGQQIV